MPVCRREISVLFLVVCLAVSLRGEKADQPVKAVFVDPDSPDARSYRTTGEYAIGRLVMTMVTDCANAVARHNELTDLPKFHLKDVPMKGGTVAGLPRITAMKLTSLKLRNPANAPDGPDELALQQFSSDLETGEPPDVMVQKITHAEGKTEWRVYKPLANIRQCGSCHGDPADMPPDLRAALEAKYPKDQAVGHRLGEWRGLIRVTVADPPKSAP